MRKKILREKNTRYNEDLHRATGRFKHYAYGSYARIKPRPIKFWYCLLTLVIVMLCCVDCRAERKIQRVDNSSLSVKILVCAAYEVLTLNPYACELTRANMFEYYNNLFPDKERPKSKKGKSKKTTTQSTRHKSM